MSTAARHMAYASAMQPTAQHQQASSRAVATFALFLCTPRSSMDSRLWTSLLTPLFACLLAAGSGDWPFARSFEHWLALR